MYKPIYNWIASVYKESYEIEFHRLEKENVKNSCILNYSLTWRNKEFNNIIDLYNHYCKLYLSIYNKGYQVILIDYYQLINGEDGYEYFQRKIYKYSDKIGDNYKMIFMKMLNKASKVHGHCVKNYKEALEKKNRNHDHYYNEIKRLNLENHLDHDLYKKIEDLTL
jgi:hypothetical protein